MVEVDAKCIHHLILINLDTLNKFKIDYVRRDCLLEYMYYGNIEYISVKDQFEGSCQII